MMNQTGHVIEYFPESEYRKNNNASTQWRWSIFTVVIILIGIIV